MASVRMRLLGWACLAWLLLAGTVAPAAEPVSKEYQIKAVFLFNLVQFVHWPDSAFATPESPLEIGILGENPFGSALDDVVHGEAIGKRQIVVRYARRLEALPTCQALFVASSERDRLDDIFNRIGMRPVLIVGDIPGFAEHGGVVGFYLDGNRVRFEINLAAAQRRGLKPSAQLLSLARIAGAPPTEP
jgi:hypothetical protein